MKREATHSYTLDYLITVDYTQFWMNSKNTVLGKESDTDNRVYDRD